MKVLAKTTYNKEGFYLEWATDFMDGYIDETLAKLSPKFSTKNDIQVVLKDKSGERLGDAICHSGSYGVEDNLWEVQVNHPPKSWHGDVLGWLTWIEVEKYFDREIRIYEKHT